MQKPQSTPALWRLSVVLSEYPVSKTAWYRGMRLGIYPRPVKIGKRAVAWNSHAVQALIEARLAPAE